MSLKADERRLRRSRCVCGAGHGPILSAVGHSAVGSGWSREISLPPEASLEGGRERERTAVANKSARTEADPLSGCLSVCLSV